MDSQQNIDFESLDLRFTVIDEQGTEVELVPGGADIQVTSENIHEYCLGVAKYHLVTSVREEIRSFLEGFHSVIP
jgi:hypothetical protein